MTADDDQGGASDGTAATGGHSTTDGADDATRPTRASWALVGGASLVSVSLAAYEIVPASVTPLISEALNIDPTATGLLISVMFGAAVLVSLPAGAVLDRTNSRSAMAVAVLALFVVGVWGWLAARDGAYWSLIASRAVGGVTYVFVWNAGIDMVSRAASDANRATAVGVFTASGPVGFALGQGTGSVVAGQFGWPAIFIVFNGLALVGLGLFWPVSRGLGRSGGTAPTLAEFGAVLRNRTVWLIGALGFLGYALYLFVNSWGTAYLTDELRLSLGLSGVLVAVFPAVGILSRISGGVLSDRLFDGRRRPVLLGSFCVAAPAILVFTQYRTVILVVALLLVAGFAIQLTLGLSFAYVREVVEPRVAATAVAFQTSVGLAGAFVAPIAGGAVVERAGFDAAFLLAGGLAICGILLAWRAPEPGLERLS
jgi:predicted MFS family arabinose efflux permease